MAFDSGDWIKRWRANAEEGHRNACLDAGWSADVAVRCSDEERRLLLELVAAYVKHGSTVGSYEAAKEVILGKIPAKGEAKGDQAKKKEVSTGTTAVSSTASAGPSWIWDIL